MYVLGKADRERMRVFPIPAVRPSVAKGLEALKEIPEATINSLWWLSRGKPRHLMKAAERFRTMMPRGPIEIHEFLNDLDSVSQAPYDESSQNVVPACYVEHLDPDEIARVIAIGPLQPGDGKLFSLTAKLEPELLAIVRDAFKMEAVAFHLVRYVIMLLEALSVDGQFALRQSDIPFLLRLAVDFLLEYERDRLEKDNTLEGGAALRKLLEVHDRAEHHAGEIFWKLHGQVGLNQDAAPAISLEAVAAAFPLPTTSPTLMGTNPKAVRARYEELKEPIFWWEDSARNTVVFLASTNALTEYSQTPDFRESALAPGSGVIVLLPHDADDSRSSGLIEWLEQQDRLKIARLPLALTDFLLSLRAWSNEGGDPVPIAQRAEEDKNLKRQVAFYRSRLQDFIAEATCRPRPSVPSEIPKRFADILGRISDTDTLTLAVQQAFESMSPSVDSYLVDLREFVRNTKNLWGRSGLISIAEDLLPHRLPQTGRIEAAKIVDDIHAAFSPYGDTLRRLSSLVSEDEIVHLTDDSGGKLALRSLWQSRRGGDTAPGQLAQYNAQLSDFARTLKGVREAEKSLKKYNVLPAFGELGALVEALPLLETLAADAAALIKTPGGTDRRLVSALFEQFLAVLVAEVAPDVNDTKVAVNSVNASIKSLEQRRTRILQAARTDAARFARIDAKDVTRLLEELQHDALQGVTSQPSLQDVADAFEEAAKDFEGVENALSRLASAYDEISQFAAKQPWKSDQSSL